MSLGQRVKDYVQNKISAKISVRMNEIKATLPKDWQETAIGKVCEKYDLTEKVDRFKELEKQFEEMRVEKNTLENELSNTLRDTLNNGSYVYSPLNFLRDYAVHSIPEILLDMGEASLSDEYEGLLKTREELEGVVLMATTSNKLRASLVKLLSHYGVDLDLSFLQDE